MVFKEKRKHFQDVVSNGLIPHNDWFMWMA